MEITCPQCGFTKDIPDDKIPPRAQVATCPKCKHKFRFRTLPEDLIDSKEEQEEKEHKKSQDLWSSLEKLNDHNNSDDFLRANEDTETDSFVEIDSVPWETLEEHGFFAGFFDTIKKVCLSPKQFFKSMKTRGGYTRPLIFYLLISELYAAFRIIWSMMGVGMKPDPSHMDFLNLGLHGLSSLLWLLLYPVFLTIFLFVAAGINHLCLILVKDGSRGFKGTFKVLCYSSAPMIMSIFPFLGPIIGVMWSSICNFLGFKYVHRTSSIKVAIAMLLPVIIIFLITLPMATHMKGM